MISQEITKNRAGSSCRVDLDDQTLYEYRCPVTDIKYQTELHYTVSQHEPNNPPTGSTHADQPFLRVKNDPTEVFTPHYAVTNFTQM